MWAALWLNYTMMTDIANTIEMATWVQGGNGDEERIVLSQEAQAMRRGTNIRDTLNTLVILY